MSEYFGFLLVAGDGNDGCFLFNGSGVGIALESADNDVLGNLLLVFIKNFHIFMETFFLLKRKPSP